MNEKTYTFEEVQELTGLSYRLVDYFSRTDLVTPSHWFVEENGPVEEYSCNDLLKLRVIKGYLDEGVRLSLIRKDIEQISKIAEERRRTAYHEAGHAVLVASLGMHFECVVINPDNSGQVEMDLFRTFKNQFLGRSFSANWKENRELFWQRDKLFLKSLAAINLAGLISEEIEFGTYETWGEDDLRSITEKIEFNDLKLRKGSDVHQFLLIAKRFWGKSFTLSKSLETYEKMWSSCKRVLLKEETWAWVERVASELCEKNKLNRYEVLNLRFSRKSHRV